jgi:hypothetical protein
METTIAVVALVVLFFNAWLVFRFVAFMGTVERSLGVIAERLGGLDRRVASAAAGTDVRLEAVVAAVSRVGAVATR